MYNNDGYQPLSFRITIANGAGLNTVDPSDGFIDPTTVEEYLDAWVMDAQNAPSGVVVGNVVNINDVPVVIESGTGIASIVADINMSTSEHHVVAINNGGKLRLTNEPMYVGNRLAVIDITPGITSALGFTAQIKNAAPGYPTLAQSIAKERANVRWLQVMEQLGFETSPHWVGGVVMAGNDIATDPTSITFTATFQSLSNIYAYDEAHNNAILYGLDAIKHRVARALLIVSNPVRTYYDPTIAPMPVAKRIESLHLVVGALAPDLTTALSNITVSLIDHTR